MGSVFSAIGIQTRRPVQWMAALLSLLASLGACSSKDTLLIVAVNSNLEIPMALTKVRAVVRGGQDELLWDHTFELAGPSETHADGQFQLPLSFSVIPREGNPDIPVKIEVEAIGPVGGDEIVLFTRTAVTKFSNERTLLLPMFLARRCITDVCKSGQTCSESGCVDEAIDVLKLQSIDPGKESEVTSKHDTTPPLITLQTKTPTITHVAAIRFDFECNEPPCSFECRLDSEDFKACRSPLIYEALADGDHDFSVRGEDSAGVSSEGLAIYYWTVDSTHPRTTISKTPELWSAVLEPSFEFACNEASCNFRCQVDNDSPQACRSPHRVGPLVDGPHVFLVAAIDSAENSDLFPPAIFWNIDTQAPTVRFLSTPPTISTSRSVSLSFVCDEPPCSFECARDGEESTACASPIHYEDLTVDSYTFSVQATDRAGNISTATTADWTVLGEWLMVDSRDKSTCAIAYDRSLWCWGANYRGELGDGSKIQRTVPTQVGRDKDWQSVSMGLYRDVTPGSQYACGIRSGGSLWCWGKVVLEFPGTEYLIPTQFGHSTHWVSISVGMRHACGISGGGELWCFGVFFGNIRSAGNLSQSPRPVRMGPERDWVSFAISATHECGLKSDQSLWCRGSNHQGTLGQGTASGESTEFLEIDQPSSSWKSVSLDTYRTCAINFHDELWCWGQNQNGELGYGPLPRYVSSPTEIMAGESWKEVALRNTHSCAIRQDGTLWCWGYNYWGEIGTDERRAVYEKNQVGTDSDWHSITAASNHSCALKTDQTLWCWGDNTSGQLGNGLRGDRDVPTQVGSDLDWQTVSAGEHHSCATKGAGELWCWGDNELLELGKPSLNSDIDSYVLATPLHIDNNPHIWRSVSAGTQFSCGISENDQLYCWGYNGSGRLGIGGSSARSATITAVRPDLNWRQVSVSANFACAIDNAGSVWCWGYNSSGQLGNGSTVTSTIPVQLAIPAAWDSLSPGRQLTSGANHACLVKDNGRLWCWGSNGSKQSGQSDTNTATVPLRTGNDMQSWAQVTAGRGYSCGQQSDGTLLCRGYNQFGMLGDGSTESQHSLVPVAMGGQWEASDAGWYHTCGIKTDDSLWCWGKNLSGEVGDGSGELQSSPVDVGLGRSWESISAGPYHSCAIGQDGSLWCWGRNQGGQLGHGVQPFSSQATETRRP